jgi:hypothetical protein
MTTPPSRPIDSRKTRRPVRHEDLRLYSAITGKSAEISKLKSESPAELKSESVAEASAPQTIGAIAKRVLAPDVVQLSLKLREICELGIANGVKRPQMADWLRHVSEEAFRRLDQAQVRLSQSRPAANRRRVEAREVHIQANPPTPINLQNVA